MSASTTAMPETANTSAFVHRDGVLHAEGVPLTRIADNVGTPVWVYSRTHLVQQYRRLEAALHPLDVTLCYAVKANSNLSILRVFADLGAGFDIVSGGELVRVIEAGADPRRVVFSGVGKSIEEIDFALKTGIGCFNVESAAELDRISARARLLGRVAAISLRVNPDVDAGTHPYISTGLRSNKFGIPISHATQLYRQAAKDLHLELHGIDCHIGSQILTPTPLIEALSSVLALVDDLAAEGIDLQHVDLGGGLGVPYRGEDPEFDVLRWGADIRAALGERKLKLVLEPGRFLVANGGVLLTSIEYLKPATEPDAPNFAIVDAAMNDLIRPALYDAWHEIEPVTSAQTTPVMRWQIVGPVCESGDFLGHDRDLALEPGALLAVRSAGAYGMAQSSNYNTRPRAAEVLVEDGAYRIVRRRETLRDLLAAELPET
ncbi:MAG: diaminopimelate decarboxylase [Pseudomonadales bacterium]